MNNLTHIPSLNDKDRQESRPVVYHDETLANAHNGKDCTWVDKDCIIIGGSGEIGWISSTTLIFRFPKNWWSRFCLLRHTFLRTIAYQSA